MNTKVITNALNKWLKLTCPTLEGFFIDKLSKEPTTIGMYKKYIYEIFYHIPNHNIKVYTMQEVFRDTNVSPEPEFTTAVLADLFINLNNIKDEITKI